MANKMCGDCRYWKSRYELNYPLEKNKYNGTCPYRRNTHRRRKDVCENFKPKR